MPNAITNITAQASSGMVRKKATAARMAKRRPAGVLVLSAAKNASTAAIQTATMVEASASCSVSQISGS